MKEYDTLIQIAQREDVRFVNSIWAIESQSEVEDDSMRMKANVDNEFNKKYKVHLGNYLDTDENICVLDSHWILVQIVQTTCQTVIDNYELELWVHMTSSDPHYMFFKFVEANGTMMEASIGDKIILAIVWILFSLFLDCCLGVVVI